MRLKLKPDYEQTKKRYDAFWEQQIIDRPPVNITLPVDDPRSVPEKEYDDYQKKWLDIDFRAEKMAIQLENREYYADSLPIVWPNMGPEIFSAWCGCDYNFGATTAWTEPCIQDWEQDADQAVFDPRHPLFNKTVEFTKKLLQLGEGKFIVGLTDFHPGGDHLAALRDPEKLALDMIENKEKVKEKLSQSYQEFFRVYNFFYNMLKKEELPITSWTPLINEKKFYIPSNDFSAMISNQMFEEVFLPGIIEECKFYDRTIYHLDGPGALRHLDSLLAIKELDAVQWVPGAGNEGFEKWIKVYQKIQQAGKSLQLTRITLDELPLVFKNLEPEGVWFSHMVGIEDKKTADRVLDRISKW
ncbi:MAG: hypothetical protein ACOC2O_02980 [Bacillota bacterium]